MNSREEVKVAILEELESELETPGESSIGIDPVARNREQVKARLEIAKLRGSPHQTSAVIATPGGLAPLSGCGFGKIGKSLGIL